MSKRRYLKWWKYRKRKENKLFKLLNKALTAKVIGPEPPPEFKPTHVTTYGSKGGIDGAFTTNLATGETVFSPLCVTFEDIEVIKFTKGIWGT